MFEVCSARLSWVPTFVGMTELGRAEPLFFPSPLEGEGGALAPDEGLVQQVSESERVEPPPHPALRATFSLEGRREGCARALG
jgi:hypothetical protein